MGLGIGFHPILGLGHQQKKIRDGNGIGETHPKLAMLSSLTCNVQSDLPALASLGIEVCRLMSNTTKIKRSSEQTLKYKK